MPDIFIESRKTRHGDVREKHHKQPYQPLTESPATAGEVDEKESHVRPVVSKAPVSHTRRPLTHRGILSSRFQPSALSQEHAKHAMFPLAAYAVDPVGVSFSTQTETEEIHIFARRHFITNLPWIILSVFLLILPPVVLPFTGDFIPFFPQLPKSVTFILTYFYYVVVLGAIVLTNFINWYFNVYIVTNERIVDIDFHDILFKEISATRLSLVQDVTGKTGGVFRAIFDYGDVFVQTAAAELAIDFHAIPRPNEVVREMEKLMEEARKREGGEVAANQ